MSKSINIKSLYPDGYPEIIEWKDNGNRVLSLIRYEDRNDFSGEPSCWMVMGKYFDIENSKVVKVKRIIYVYEKAVEYYNHLKEKYPSSHISLMENITIASYH